MTSSIFGASPRNVIVTEVVISCPSYNRFIGSFLLSLKGSFVYRLKNVQGAERMLSVTKGFCLFPSGSWANAVGHKRILFVPLRELSGCCRSQKDSVCSPQGADRML